MLFCLMVLFICLFCVVCCFELGLFYCLFYLSCLLVYVLLELGFGDLIVFELQTLYIL